MRAGRLRHRVTLQSQTRVASITGELIPSYQDEVTVSAEVLETRGREYLTSNEAHAEITVKITIRYRTDIGPTWRVIFGSRIFDIKHVVDLMGRHRTLELMCKELVS